MKSKLKQEIDDLLYLTLENEAIPEQIKRLDMLLESDPALQRYAADFYFVTASLRKTNAIPSASFETSHEINEQYNLLLELAQEEKTAPVLEMLEAPQKTQCIHPIEKARIDKSVPQINRVSLGVAISSLAALLILIVYVRTVPPRESVAVLVDSINAQWQNSPDSIGPGHLFYNTDAPMLVKSGIIEIEFDYGAHVVIEGPCEFVCKADNLIYLDYGRLYARVPPQATGFTVDTKNARIVDLGTEFGVLENVDETTELHVLKGRTTLLAGQEMDKTVFEVLRGQALQVSEKGASVKEISVKENTFVQQINSKTGLIRKGQRVIDLADILGGGNGFGTGQRNVGMNPVTGKISLVTESNRKADNVFHRTASNPFIDGVFVPNGRTTQRISSLGHIFLECPVTQGNYYTEISGSPARVDNTEVVLGGVNYSREAIGSLFVHANLGITYDLKTIRSQLSGVHITGFQSTIGVCDTSWRPCNADFWILVDGKLRYRQKNVQQKGIIGFADIELSENDRFLTLVTTDGGDPNIRMFGNGTIESMDSDWCLFAQPVLVLE